ncbi:ester cyclase [Glutamicibacter sp.]|uniref:ester cyclase n=1 Tax=Glutamicibacter sp. TaxID=1931995 RepID=UPI0028BD4FBE|nr:ester cyclase [Glutamicibacter sp.]
MDNIAMTAARRVFDAINSGDLSCIKECVTEDFVDHGSPIPIPPGFEGYTQILTFVTQVLKIKYTLEDVFSTEDRIVVRAVARGIGAAEFHGPEAVGAEYEMATIHIFRTEGEKLAEHWGVRDELGAMRRMGVLPALGE